MANETVLPGLPADPKTQWDAKYTDRPDLMPCPFCGESPNMITWLHPTWAMEYQVVCVNKICKCIAATVRRKTMREVVELWTRRPIITEVVITDDETQH